LFAQGRLAAGLFGPSRIRSASQWSSSYSSLSGLQHHQHYDAPGFWIVSGRTAVVGNHRLFTAFFFLSGASRKRARLPRSAGTRPAPARRVSRLNRKAALGSPGLWFDYTHHQDSSRWRKHNHSLEEHSYHDEGCPGISS